MTLRNISQVQIVTQFWILTTRVSANCHSVGCTLPVKQQSVITTEPVHGLCIMQLYVTFRPLVPGDETDTAGRVEACGRDIRLWMLANLMKLNATKANTLYCVPEIWVILCYIPSCAGQTDILPRPAARNIGVIFDSDLTLQTHISRMCQTAYMHLKNISAIFSSLNSTIGLNVWYMRW